MPASSSTRHSPSSRRRASARSTPSAPTCSASGRSRRASTRSSRWLPRTWPRASSTAPSTAGSRRSSRIPGRRCAASSAGAPATTVRARDHDGLEAELLGVSREKHWRWTGFRRVPAGFPKAELLERRTRLRAALDDFVRRAGADLAPRLRDELWPVVEGHEALKNRAGCLDFLDLLLRARDLVRENTEVRAELQRRFTHLFVDEFQDTDPLQVEILLLLAADDPRERDWRRVRPVAGKLFLVGDPKQSIYRFRRADVALYERVKR